MNPFFFGSSETKLYGVYHPPRAASPRDSGVVLCAPFGQEYMRSHRAFRQLATMLTKDGHHVMRFDYFGTGDSYGEGVEGSLEQWVEDVGVALEELRDTASVSKLSLVGLRLGASLAAEAASRRIDLSALVVWDAVVDGRTYLDELLRDSGALHNNGARSERADVVNVRGFPLTSRMRGRLAELDLLHLARPGAQNVFVTVSEEAPEFHELVRHLDAVGAPVTYRYVESPNNWSEVDEFGSMLLPHGVIKDIVECLAEVGT